ncbi:nicotinate-nucleotide adenylyltransferase [Desulfofustis glycolicus]|uniref:Probable nicotinate-nucleotide adenylyltransferase n=1 Tax=Desulfofustis glycolicus DSM 9705 TaxID=1121409 RepID=A0A1M5WWH7_9BACT|nr:nicotinate-nucleotide adenylyltransferase [Desulfofustis glycolicus]MCB2214478.1 nicotinate-nucleotide adenylyltransferase [Desulfobulbaceae bacterium]SHH91668.1 nicotinate-nucleotide adenylyltransferase [Desulfofustis glycolicus DSM 9705]
MHTTGLLGGTFDPVHNGHLQLAQAVLARSAVDQVLFIPAASPPHKTDSALCPIEHRLEMVRRAISPLPRCAISKQEAFPGRPSYTIDTLLSLRADSHGETTYVFIIGGDAFLEIETWHRWSELLASTDFIVAVRRGSSLEELIDVLDYHGFCPQPETEPGHYRGREGNSVRVLTAPIDDISSTDIRCRIAENKPWQHLVPLPVAEYIDEQRLYRQD